MTIIFIYKRTVHEKVECVKTVLKKTRSEAFTELCNGFHLQFLSFDVHNYNENVILSETDQMRYITDFDYTRMKKKSTQISKSKIS